MCACVWVCVGMWVMSVTNVYTIRKIKIIYLTQFLLFKFLALCKIEAREIISPLSSFSISYKLEDNY